MIKKEIEGLTISIITRLHERYDKENMDDADYIPLIKSVIIGAVDFAEDFEISKVQQKKIKENIYSYARGIYLEGWLNNVEEDDEDRDVARKEGMDWYDYIYKNEKYPR